MPEYEVFIDGKPRKIELTRSGENSLTVKMDGRTRTFELVSREFDRKKPLEVRIDNKSYRIELPEMVMGKEFSVRVDEATFNADVKSPARTAGLATFEPVVTTSAKRANASKQVVEGAVNAPMTGKIVSVKVKRGEQVKAGQVLCVIEAMKMENEITSSKTGTVKEVYASEGSSVSEGEPLLVIS